MSHLLPFLRSASVVAATLAVVFPVGGTFTASAIAVTTASIATFATTSEAQAERPRVRDHRKPCPPYIRGCPPYPRY